MSGSLNKVLLIGNVGADPEIRHAQDGRPWAAFSLATSQRWRDRDTGERCEKTEWHKVVVFAEAIAKVVEAHVRKGSKLYLEGALATTKWRDRDGRDRWSTEVVLTGFNAKLVLLGESASARREAAATAAATTTTSSPAHVAERPSRRARQEADGEAAPAGDGRALDLSGAAAGEDDPDDGIPF